MEGKVWFTADTHFGHTKIIEWCKRPYKSVEEMDKMIMHYWNQLINPEDTVYHLGDFAWRHIGRYVEQLNGNIHLIRGSHDRQIGNFSHHFVTVTDLNRVVIEGNVIIMCHYAMRVWQASHFNSWQLFGHSHGRLQPTGKQWDVGVDNNKYLPVPYSRIAHIMHSQPDNPNLVLKKEE